MDKERVKELFHEIGLAFQNILKRMVSFVRRHWKIFLTILVVIAVVIAFCVIGNHRQYKDYTARASVKLEDAEGMQYVSFENNILRYSADGAFYTDINGHLLWNQTYDMTDPRVYICGSYLMIYDKSGTDIYLLTSTGLTNKITTSLPIVQAEVASQGTVAVLMQEEKTGYIRLYNLDGNTLASGEVHLEKTGYPLGMAFSEDAQNLVLSLADLNNGDVKTTLNFYNFGSGGSSAANNIEATYSYANAVIPRLTYMEDGRLVAFGDNELIVFSSNTKPKVEREIHISETIRSIFYNKQHFGIITDSADGQKMQMTVYNSSGRERMHTDLTMSYSRVEMLSNNEILLTNDTDIALFNLSGVEKYRDTLESNIYEVFPQEGSRDYIFVRDGYMEQARLR